MQRLSITTCSFYLKRKGVGTEKDALLLNGKQKISDENGVVTNFNNCMDLFYMFFNCYKGYQDDSENSRSFKFEYGEDNVIDNDDYKIYTFKVNSGLYGSSSDIINKTTKKLQYRRQLDDIEVKDFYFFIVFPKDALEVRVQKGMFIFQNVGSIGVKTMVTDQIYNFFSEKFGISLNCRTVAPSVFVNKVLKKENILELTMVKNYKSSDQSDNIYNGYGQETRTISRLRLSDSKWDEIKSKINYVAGSKNNLFEFDSVNYDRLRAKVKFGDKCRSICINNIDRLSIIEPLPDDFYNDDGNVDIDKLTPYVIDVVSEYLKDFVLYF